MTLQTNGCRDALQSVLRVGGSRDIQAIGSRRTSLSRAFSLLLF